MTIPYEKYIVAYKKLTSAYDVFHVLADDHNHVCLGNPFMVPESNLLQRFSIQEGQPDIPHHGGCHHDVDVCI